MPPTNAPDPDLPPHVMDPPPGSEPVIPERDPTHSPVVPDPTREPSPKPTTPERPTQPEPASKEEQEHEVDEAWTAIAVGPVTKAMAKGAIAGALAGAAIGVVLGALLALIPFAGWPYLGRFALLGAVSVLACSTAGFIYGGGREAELEGDVGNQIGPAPLLEPNRDPPEVRRAVSRTVQRREARATRG